MASGTYALLAMQLCMSLVLTGLIIAQMFTLSVIVDAAFMQSAGLSELTGYLWVLGALIVARAVAIKVHHSSSALRAIRIKTRLRQLLFDHWTRVGPALIQQERTGELAATYFDGLDKIELVFSRYLPRLMNVLVTPLIIALCVLTVDLLSGLLLLSTAPLIPLFMWLIGSMAQKRSDKQWLALSRMSAHFLDTVQGMTTLKLFGRSQHQEKEIERASRRYRVTTMAVLKVAFLSALVLELAASLSTAIVAVQIGVRLVEGQILFQPGLFVLLLAPEFYLPFRQLGAEHHAAMEGRTAANRYLEFLDQPALRTPAGRPATPPAAPFDIRIEGLSFTYPNRDQPALSDLNTWLHAGEITALVGSSGAGKSTLLQVLAGQLDPGSGRILLGDVPLDEMDRQTWRNLITVVPQRVTLFAGTLRHNIALARPDATDDEVVAAATAAAAHDFIKRLPDGYDTIAGEQAWRLSGGERQRIALARAFLKDAPVLLLDEPTANLDPDTEESMARAFERLARGRLTFVIAHRLRTVYRAHRILVLDQGRLVEEGSHAELSRQQGRYARLIGGAT